MNFDFRLIILKKHEFERRNSNIFPSNMNLKK